MFKWDKVFKSGLSKFCGRQPLKNLLIPLLNTLSRMIVEKVRTQENIMMLVIPFFYLNPSHLDPRLK